LTEAEYRDGHKIIERFKAATKLNPEDACAHYDLAKALLQKEAAQLAYRKAKQLDPRLKPPQ
jgi:Flp pilus assembly protein TadD